MAAGDDGGFTPHPGDPWHPGWTPDSTEDTEGDPQSTSEGEAVEPTGEDESTGRRGKRKRRRGKRRRRKDSESVEYDPVQAAAFDPSSTAFDAPDVVPDADGEDEDPFEAVLEQEQDRGSRRGGDEKAPPPAWTVDPDPTDEQSLPIEQPSWAGTATGGAEPITAEGFDEGDGLEPTPTDSPTEEPEGVSAEGPVGPGAPEASEGLPQTQRDAGEPEIVGEFGVAGPEAYDVLGDIESDGMDEWDAFTQGEAAVPAEGAREADALEPVADEPEQPKRRWFGRSRDGEEGLDELPAEPAQPPPGPGVPASDPESALSAPAEALGGGDVFDDWVASAEEEPERTGWFGRRKRRRQTTDAREGAADWVEPESLEPDAPEQSGAVAPGAVEPEMAGDTAGLVPEALDSPTPIAEQPAPEELTPETIAEVDELIEGLGDLAVESVEVEPVDEGLPVDGGGVDTSFDLDAAVGAALDELGDEPDTGTQPELFGEQPLSDATAAGEPADPDAVEAPDWEGDPSRVPTSWFADVDEDEVVPPPVADTPETEWPAPQARVDEPEDEVSPSHADVAPPEGVGPVAAEGDVVEVTDPGEPSEPPSAPQPTVETDPDSEVFDHEAPVEQPASPVVPVVDEAAPVPAGYEPWAEAVDEALAGAEGPDDATYEYEPLLEQQPAAAEELPAGFEQFPGDMEQFQLSAEELAAELGTGERGWVTHAVDSGEDGDAEFDEQIYAGPGTVVHQDLAAAIEAEGEDLTQWQALSAAMPGLETGVLGFEDVADLADEGDYVAPSAQSNLGARVATGVVLVGLLFGTLLLSDVAFAVFIGALLMLGLVEFYAALRRSGYLPLTLFGVLGGAATLVATWFHGPIALPVGVFLTSTLTFFFYAFSPTRRDALANGGLTVLGVGWVVATVGFVIPIARTEDPVPLIVAVVVATAAMDVGAYSFGRTWGRRPLSPVLSPNKTTEGLVGGALLSVAVVAAFGFLGIGPFEVGSALLLGAVIVVLAPLGDLAESMVKRSLGIKDMGATLPGHGGVLDRIDAFLFVVPGAWAFFELSGFLG